MKWNLRLTAAQRGIWQSTDLRRALAEAGLRISSGKMSYLWSRRPISIKLDDLDVICSVLDCEPSDLLIKSAPAESQQEEPAVQQAQGGPKIMPSRDGKKARSLPPV